MPLTGFCPRRKSASRTDPESNGEGVSLRQKRCEDSRRQVIMVGLAEIFWLEVDSAMKALSLIDERLRDRKIVVSNIPLRGL